jgi:RNA polymerase sigma-70 factor (ECF subfamily)
MRREEERALVHRCRGGDGDAFGPLVQAYEGRVYGFLVSLCRHPDEARDLAQETFIRAWRKLEQYEADRPLLPWLLAIARSRFRDMARSRRSHVRLDEERESGPRDLPDPAPASDDLSDRRERYEQLWRALDRLSEHHRSVLLLKDVSDLSYAEVAAILGVPVGTVGSRVHLARRALRDALAERDEPVSASGGVAA